MRVELGENLGNRTLNIFREAGHDVQTTREEGLQGCPDPTFTNKSNYNTNYPCPGRMLRSVYGGSFLAGGLAVPREWAGRG